MSSSSNLGNDNTNAPVALNPEVFQDFKVSNVEILTHDTKQLTFDLPSKDHILGLPIASCLVAKALIDGEEVIKAYTPITDNDVKGHMKLVVKGYATGRLSKYIVNLQVGDSLLMKGPKFKYPYQFNEKECIGMVAGGTGIAPMYQILQYALKHSEDKTKFVLLYGNQTNEDIILYNELEDLQNKHSERLKIYYCVTAVVNEKWNGLTGLLSKEMLDTYMPPSDEKNLVMVCGPKPMMRAICGSKDKVTKTQGALTGYLKELGYQSSTVYKF